MTQEEYLIAMRNVVYLAACVVNGETPDQTQVRAIDLKNLFQAAKRHSLTSIVASALESVGVADEEFHQERAKAMRKNAVLDAERNAMLQRMEQAGIWYMPLKGSVLKDLYPGYGVRQMADNDILFDQGRAEDVKSIMEELGFTVRIFGAGNHDVYYKPPVCNFELHRSLFGTAYEQRVYDYYKDVKNRLVKDENHSFGWHFTDEDFYLYMVVHEYKHYSHSGTGLRSLLDTYVFLQKKPALDFNYIEAEEKQLGIEEFERTNRSLSMHLFGGGMLTAAEQEMLDYILGSGTYGTMENGVRNQLKRHGRWGYLRRRAFLPLKSMRILYPVLDRVPALLPLCWGARWGKALINKRKTVALQLETALKWKSEME